MTISNKFAFGFAVLAGLVALAQPAAKAQTYTVIDLGTLGGVTSGATGVNDRGQVSGWSTTSTSSCGFLSGACGGGLKPTGPTTGPNHSMAYSVNNHGEVVGLIGDEANSRFLGWYTDKNAYNVFNLAADSGVPLYSSLYPVSVNDSGQMCGYYATHGAPEQRAFYLSSGSSAVKDLGSLGGADCLAHAINSRGQVVGISSTAAGSEHAFLSAPDGGVLSDIAPTYSFSGAMGVNSVGQVTGWIDVIGGAQHAFLTDPNGGTVHDLGASGGTYGEGMAVNDSGIVVGDFVTPTNVVNGFVLRNGKLVNLNTLVPGNSGVVIRAATAISNTGFIAGVGRLVNTVYYHAILLVPRASDIVAPTSLVAIPHDGAVELHWNGAVGASSYVIYRSTVAGGVGHRPLTAGITSTSYVDTERKNGVTYYYKVAAEDNTGVTGQSNEASATPVAQ